jgi:hypothetical protein
MHLAPAWNCFLDLDGEVKWQLVKDWADHHGVKFDWLWAVMRMANSEVAQWRSLKSSKATTARAKSLKKGSS